MVKVEINGKEIEAQPGETVIQVADRENVYIPRFCYHKKLSAPANCRMCLVEVEKSGKPLPACATQVSDGMKVFTQSEKTTSAQKAVMEFLLINHPLDCPVCDQGGQCELQDLAMGYGADTSGFVEMKRAVPNPDLGPLIATDMTRCIHCTRCVRFEEEVAGERELGGMFRGEHQKITTYAKQTVQSELSGNAIDVCPVGALTSRPFRFKARAWEMTQTPSISAHDCLGSNIDISTLRGQLLRVTPYENEAINEVWLSDRDRFAYVGIHSEQRVHKPMIKKDGEWQTVQWEEAFHQIVETIRPLLHDYGAESFGALTSPSATTEEMYLLQSFMRALGSDNIDHRLREEDCSDQHNAPLFPGLGINIADIPDQQALLLVGSNIRKDQPIAGMKVRQAALNGADIFAVNLVDYPFNFDVTDKLIVKPSQMIQALAEIAKALVEQQDHADEVMQTLLQAIKPGEQARQIAQGLAQAERGSIIMGLQAFSHPEAAKIRQLTTLIADLSGSTIGCLTQGANAQGGWLTGCVPHREAAGQVRDKAGLTATQMLQDPLKAYLLLNTEPELDSLNSAQALAALKAAECVITITPFATEAVKEYATIILPAATFGETSGTFVNIQGEWQQFQGVVAPKGEARPAWKILRVLGNLFELEGFEYTSSEQVLAEIRHLVETSEPITGNRQLPESLSGLVEDNKLERIGDLPTYATDCLVRQSEPLQAMHRHEQVGSVHLNPTTAERRQLKAGQKVTIKQRGQLRLPVVINKQVPEDCVWIKTGVQETVGLGAAYGAVDLEI